MVVVTLKDGTQTTRSMREIKNEFIETKDYDYIQFSKTDPNFEPQPIIEEWLKENYPCEDAQHEYDLKWFLFQSV